MSASERLRELDAAMRYDSPSDRATFVRGRDAEHGVLAALPEIVAVVEAAETWVTSDALDDVESEYDAIVDALAALEEKLKPAEDKKEPTPAFDEWEKHWKTKP